MAQISPALITIFFLLFLITLTKSSAPDLTSELLTLQTQSKTGLIHLTDQTLARYITSLPTPRPYALLIFFDAHQLHSKPELRLTELKQEFSLLSKSFQSNNPNEITKLFFCEIEFKESQHGFSLFGVNSLPHIRLVGPNVRNFKDSEQMEQGDFGRLADGMRDFVERRTKLSVGEIHRPPFLSKKQLGFVVLVVLGWTPFFVRKVVNGDTLLSDKRAWLSGAVFVYFFSVSGAMHNIIRKMPMFLLDRNDPSKLVFFYQGSGMQLGAEGFAVGFLYTVVGLLLAGVTHLLVKVRNVTLQRVVMAVALFVSFWAVKKVIYLDNWKTGYGVHGYWPSSW